MSKYHNVIVAVAAVLALTTSHPDATTPMPPLQSPPQLVSEAVTLRKNRPVIIDQSHIIEPQKPPELKWSDTIEIAAKAAEGYVVFVNNATEINPTSATWPEEKVVLLAAFYDRAVNGSYAGRKGFASIEDWATACKISKDAPILVIYDKEHARGTQPTVSWYGSNPVITYGKVFRTQITFYGIQLATHELAHVWDGAHNWELGAAVAMLVQNPGNYPTAKARNEDAREDFAESVTAYFWPSYAVNIRWSDDDLRFYERYDELPDKVWTLDRYDYIARLFHGETVAEIGIPERNPSPVTDDTTHAVFSDTPDIPTAPQHADK